MPLCWSCGSGRITGMFSCLRQLENKKKYGISLETFGDCQFFPHPSLREPDPSLKCLHQAVCPGTQARPDSGGGEWGFPGRKQGAAEVHSGL